MVSVGWCWLVFLQLLFRIGNQWLELVRVVVIVGERGVEVYWLAFFSVVLVECWWLVLVSVVVGG